MKIPENLKKNCINCEHIEWAFGDVNDPEGFACNKRDYSKKGNFFVNEKKHLKQLGSIKYRNHGKKCHEKKV